MKEKWKVLFLLFLLIGLTMLLSVYMPWNSRERCPDVRAAAAVTPNCRKPLEEEFAERPKVNVEPFLSSRCKLSEEAFAWWKGLQGEKGSLDGYRKTVENLLKTFPSGPQEAGPPRHRLCAVVGNSLNLKGSKYGPLIDSHEVVIRMNSAPTRGFEEDVGSRTSHRVVYPESAVDVDNKTHLVLFPFKIQDLDWLVQALTTGFHGKSYMPVRSTIKANKNLVMVVNPAFMMYVHLEWLERRGKYPSTGFMTLLVALHICQEVDVFGYGADKDGNWSHYWEKLKVRNLKTGVHPGTREYDIIQRLAALQKLRFFRGW